MFKPLRFLLLGLLLFSLTPGRAQDTLPRHESNLSLRNEVQIAISKGLAWLKLNQNPDGSWSLNDYPALTALPICAFLGDPSTPPPAPADQPPHLQKAFHFLIGSVQPDGGIYRKGLANYNTSISLLALVLARDPTYTPLIRSAHDFVVGQQAKNLPDASFDGGIGYGPTGTGRGHPDLDNTVVALEAIRQSESIAGADRRNAPKLDWAAATAFIQRCQNLPQVNHAAYVSTAPEDRGGFIYYPGESNAGETTLPGRGVKAARSYGSMSYAGLLSYVYADLNKSDPRVTAAVDWLKLHYSVEENPGLGLDGLFYYYQVMAKALATYGDHHLQNASGQPIDWTKDLSLKLINLQQEDGSWRNESGRWMEKDPVLATSYSILTLEMIYRQL